MPMTPQQLPVCDVAVERCHGETVRRVTETQHYVLNRVETSAPITRVYYECPECGRRLGVLK